MDTSDRIGGSIVARNYNWKTGCNVEATLSVIGGRWKPILVCHLLDGRKRFGELRRLTPNATERMITLQLRELEADGVVSRHVYAEVPPRVEYEVTELGRSLETMLALMQEWGSGFKARKLAEEAKGGRRAGAVDVSTPASGHGRV